MLLPKSLLRQDHVRAGIFQPPLLVAVLLAAYVLAVLVSNAGDPMAFVNIGGRFDPRVPNHALGYDGQFAYQIARAPLEAAPYLDAPAYRYQRILYPMLAWLFSLGGNPVLLPWALILLNWAALVAGTSFTAEILAETGYNRWYSVLFGLFVGLALSLRLSLTEPLAFALVQGATWALLRKRLALAGAGFALAALSRELTLTFALAAFLALWLEGRRKYALGWGMLTVLPFAAWQIILKLWLGSWGVSSGGAFATSFELLPFRGWWSLAEQVPPLVFAVLSLVIVPLALLPALVSIIVAGKAIWQGKRDYAVLALLLNGLIFPFLPQSNVLQPLALARVAAGLVTAVMNYGALSGSRRSLNYALLWLVASLGLIQDALVGNING